MYNTSRPIIVTFIIGLHVYKIGLHLNIIARLRFIYAYKFIAQYVLLIMCNKYKMPLYIII